MTRFQFTVTIDGLGTRQHRVNSDDSAEAYNRILKAYPGRKVKLVECRSLVNHEVYPKP